MPVRYKLRDTRQLKNILFENDDDFLKGESSLSEDEDYLYERPSSSDPETGTEVESDDEENWKDADQTVYNETSEKVKQATTTTKDQFDQQEPVLKGKNGFIWNLLFEEDQRRVLPCPPGALHEARGTLTPREYWDLLIDNNMRRLIVKNTNIEITKRRQRQRCTNIPYHTDITMKELNAFCGLLYLSGFQKICNNNINELWSDIGCNIFRCTMTQARFLILFTCLRFDDKNTRCERQSDDPYAIIRELWDMFIANCQKYYSPSQYCTIDTQVLSYHPMKMKPDSYGFKIMTLNDARTFYMYNAILPYMAEALPGETAQYYYMKLLSEPIHKSNRTIVTNSWFTSVELLEAMLCNYNLTVIGNIKKDKAHIPDEMKRRRQIGSSLFCYNKKMTLFSYISKKDRAVLLLSSLYLTEETEENDKPKILNVYNNTKKATKNFDQLCRKYTTARKTRHWPMRFFLTMLDQAGINALILHACNRENEKLRRREFLKNLAFSLILPFLQKRLQKDRLNQTIRKDIKEILKIKLLSLNS